MFLMRQGLALILTLSVTRIASSESHTKFHETRSYIAAKGPFVLHERLYNNRNGVVFRVTDANSNSYALKSFAYLENSIPESIARKKIAFANDALISRKVTLEACPDLLNATESVSVTCQNHHLQLLLGRNVPVDSDASGEPVAGKKTMTIPSSKGIESKRVIDFSDNILIPYMEGGRLSDIFNTVPRYQSTMLRYPLYVTVATRLVDAVRFLHEHHIAHLAIEPSSIVCSSFDCDEIMLTDFSRSTVGAAISPYANEMMQDSVRFISYEEPAKDEDAEDPSAVLKPNDKIMKEFQAYAIADMKNPDWVGALQVDWYAVGGTFYSILVRTRFAPDAHSGGSITKYLAEYIFKTFEDKKVLERVNKDTESSDTLKRVRNSVSEGLMLIEGLLNPNRAERISLDKTEDGNERTERVRRGLRASHALMSSLQLDDKQNPKSKKSTSCASFMEQTVKSSRILNGIDVNEKSNLPIFMREFC